MRNDCNEELPGLQQQAVRIVCSAIQPHGAIAQMHFSKFLGKKHGST